MWAIMNRLLRFSSFSRVCPSLRKTQGSLLLLLVKYFWSKTNSIFFFVPSRPVTTWVLYYSKKKGRCTRDSVVISSFLVAHCVCVCVCVRACAREEINTTVGLCMRSFCGLFSSFSSSCFICCSSFSHGRRKFALAPNHIDLVNRHFHLQHQCG